MKKLLKEEMAPRSCEILQTLVWLGGHIQTLVNCHNFGSRVISLFA